MLSIVPNWHIYDNNIPRCNIWIGSNKIIHTDWIDCASDCSFSYFWCSLFSEIDWVSLWGMKEGFWVMWVIAMFEKKCLSFPNLRFWGCNDSSNSDLSQSGGSLKSKVLQNQFFQVSLGSTTGSSNYFLRLVRKSRTLSSSIFSFKF